MLDLTLQNAIASVPPGAWCVGVSGGADSVALLTLLRDRHDLQLTVAHLDHETRAGASALDAGFVRDLCEGWRLPCEIATLSSVEPDVTRRLRNVSARYRVARLSLYERVVGSRHLQGVILAHHADDQAETVFHRLHRGARAAGLAGMAVQRSIGGLTVLRPLLSVGRPALRDYLRARGQPWREDESNASPRYARNRIRRLLAARPALVGPLLELGEDCRVLNEWLRAQAPRLDTRFHVDAVRALPLPIARRALARWLRQRSAATGAPIESGSIERLLEMVLDAASPPRRHFPGRLLVCRRRGEIFVANHVTE